MFGLIRTVLSFALLWLILNLGYCQLGWMSHPQKTSEVKMNAGVCWPQRLAKTDGPLVFADTLWQLGLGQGPQHFFNRFGVSFSSDNALPSFDCNSLDKGKLLFGVLDLGGLKIPNTSAAPSPTERLTQQALKAMDPKGNSSPVADKNVNTTTQPIAIPKPIQERGSL